MNLGQHEPEASSMAPSGIGGSAPTGTGCTAPVACRCSVLTVLCGPSPETPGFSPPVTLLAYSGSPYPTLPSWSHCLSFLTSWSLNHLVEALSVSTCLYPTASCLISSGQPKPSLFLILKALPSASCDGCPGLRGGVHFALYDSLSLWPSQVVPVTCECVENP